MTEGNYDNTHMILSAYSEMSQKNPFRFHNMWCNHSSLLATVRRAWSIQINGCAMYKVHLKMKNVKETLRILNKNGFGYVEASELNNAQVVMHSKPDDIEMISMERDALEQP